jgi:hypothetical protein
MEMAEVMLAPEVVRAALEVLVAAAPVDILVVVELAVVMNSLEVMALVVAVVVAVVASADLNKAVAVVELAYMERVLVAQVDTGIRLV